MYTLSSVYVPVDRGAHHLQGHQTGKGFTLLKGRNTHSQTAIARTFGLWRALQTCNSDTDLVGNERFLCSTKPVSAEFFLYHLPSSCLKATIPITPQHHNVIHVTSNERLKSSYLISIHCSTRLNTVCVLVTTFPLQWVSCHIWLQYQLIQTTTSLWILPDFLLRSWGCSSCFFVILVYSFLSTLLVPHVMFT